MTPPEKPQREQYPGYTQYGYQDYFPEGIDFKRYFSLIISNWYLFAVMLFLTLTLAYGINRYSEKSYTVSSTLLIRDDQSGGGYSGLENIIPGGDIFRTRQNLRNEIGILMSLDLNREVMMSLPQFHVTYISVGRRGIAETKLYRNCPFIVSPADHIRQSGGTVYLEINSKDSLTITIDGESPLEHKLSFGDRFVGSGFDFTVDKRYPEYFRFDEEESNRYYFKFENPEVLANSYRNRLSVQTIEEESSVVTLSVTGAVWEQEADYLNKLMEVYIKYGLDLKNETADSTIAFIDNQLVLIEDSLTKAEVDLETFRQNSGVIDISNEAIILQDQLIRLGNEKVTLDLQEEYYQYLLKYLTDSDKSGEIISPAIMGITDPLISELISDYSLFQRQKRQLRFNLSENLPSIALAEKNIEETEKALMQNIESGIRKIGVSIENVNGRISDLQNRFRQLPSTERSLINYQRLYDLNNTVYTYLLEKRAEAEIARASNVPDNRIIDEAGVFSTAQISPRERQNYLMAILAGIFIPVFLIVLIDFLNNKIIDKKDVQRGTSAPILGYISHNDFKTETPVVDNPGSTLAESFRSIRTSLKNLIGDIDSPVIAVSSTISAEGKTFVSMNLSSVLAMLDKKVLLVGMDLRRPRLNKVLGVDSESGLSTFLSEKISFAEAVKETAIPNLWFTASGAVPPNPAELIESERMKQFLDMAREEFDFIIIDTPPIAIVTDALLINSLVDTYMLVVRQRYTSRNTLSLIQELLENGTIDKMGIVINDISLTGYYGYGLRYGYAMGYGYTYGYNYYGDYINYRYGYSEKSREYYKEA